MFLFNGKPNVGDVAINPDIFNFGLRIRRLIITNAPIACPYKNKGKSFDAYLMRTSTSIYKSAIVYDPLGPPDNPKPLKSTK